ARLHNDVSKIRGGIRRIPTIIGRDVKFFGFLEGGSCQAQVSEIGESAAFQKFCTCDQELCSAFSAFGGSMRGQCPFTPEIRERTRSTRFRNIDSGAISIRQGELSQRVNGCEPVFCLTCRGLSISETQTVIEIVGKEAE